VVRDVDVVVRVVVLDVDVVVRDVVVVFRAVCVVRVVRAVRVIRVVRANRVLNYVAFNVGYHNEHHDFPRVPGFKLPTVKKIAAEFYDDLACYDSWCSVIYQYSTRPDIAPFSRVIRANASKQQETKKVA
jgi:fatty acid desaturase